MTEQVTTCDTCHTLMTENENLRGRVSATREDIKSFITLYKNLDSVPNVIYTLFIAKLTSSLDGAPVSTGTTTVKSSEEPVRKKSRLDFDEPKTSASSNDDLELVNSDHDDNGEDEDKNVNGEHDKTIKVNIKNRKKLGPARNADKEKSNKKPMAKEESKTVKKIQPIVSEDQDESGKDAVIKISEEENEATRLYVLRTKMKPGDGKVGENLKKNSITKKRKMADESSSESGSGLPAEDIKFSDSDDGNDDQVGKTDDEKKVNKSKKKPSVAKKGKEEKKEAESSIKSREVRSSRKYESVPQKPTNAYNLWLSANREKIKKKYPSVTLSTMAGMLWKTENKDEWEAMYQLQRAEYDEAMQKFRCEKKIKGYKDK